jgi:hypothetical protein
MPGPRPGWKKTRTGSVPGPAVVRYVVVDRIRNRDNLLDAGTLVDEVDDAVSLE